MLADDLQQETTDTLSRLVRFNTVNPPGNERPALEYLGHLWNPGEGGSEGLEYLWDSIESRYHLSRGWQSQVARVRDQIALVTLRVLQERADAARSSW